MESPSISSLPNELLLKVFREALIFPLSYWDPMDWDHPWHKMPYIRIVTITHVCRRWRVVALHTPEFWTTVDVDRPMDCFDAFLERSKPHLLTVNALSRHLRDPNLMDLERLFLEVPRCRSLNIGSPGTPFTDQMFNDTYPWDRCAQVIESINHGGYNSRETYNHLPLLFQYELSALKSLTWSGWRLDNLMELNCPRLTKLVFENDVVTLPWTRWLDFLRTTPLLQILELSEAVDPEPLHSMSSRSLPDSVVHLPHLSSLRLFGNRELPETRVGLGELALFTHLEFPSHAAIAFDMPHTGTTSSQIIETIEARLMQPTFRNEHTGQPAMIAINCCSFGFDVSVWETISESQTICWQWQRTQSSLPPTTLNLRFDTTGVSGDTLTSVYTRTAHLLGSVYSFHLLETLVFQNMPETLQQTELAVGAFRSIFQKMVNVRTLHLRGYCEDTLLENILGLPVIPHMDDELPSHDNAQESPQPFPSLKTISLGQYDSSTPFVPGCLNAAPIPEISQITNALQRRKTDVDCPLDVVHICAKSGSYPPADTPAKCGGSCYRTADPLHFERLPLFGSDSLSILDTCIRSGMANDSY